MIEALQAWNNVNPDDFGIHYAGQCSAELPEDLEVAACIGHPDGINTVQFVTSFWVDKAGCFGIVPTTDTETSGRIEEADIYIVVNANEYGTVYTARDLFLGEFGHAVGLGHECNYKATMCHGGQFGYPANDCLAHDTCSGPTADDRNGLNAIYDDGDGDGCVDVEEYNLRGPSPESLGGARDWDSQWDFFDVPVPALKPGQMGTKNGVITLADVLAVQAFAVTANNGPPNSGGYDYDSDINGNGVEDGVEYDRTPSDVPDMPWRSGPPNGSVTLQDVLVALSSVGHTCTSSNRP